MERGSANEKKVEWKAFNLMVRVVSLWLKSSNLNVHLYNCSIDYKHFFACLSTRVALFHLFTLNGKKDQRTTAATFVHFHINVIYWLRVGGIFNTITITFTLRYIYIYMYEWVDKILCCWHATDGRMSTESHSPWTRAKVKCANWKSHLNSTYSSSCQGH